MFAIALLVGFAKVPASTKALTAQPAQGSFCSKLVFFLKKNRTKLIENVFCSALASPLDEDGSEIFSRAPAPRPLCKLIYFLFHVFSHYLPNNNACLL